MDQTHIGYTYWQQPDFNKMPDVKYLQKDSIVENIDATADVPINSEYLIPIKKKGNFFYEENQVVSINAIHFSKAINTNNIKWKIIPGLGRTGSSITSFPVTTNKQIPKEASPQLQYEIYSYDSGLIKINAYFSPTLNFHNEPQGLQYAISIDNERPQIISINKEDNDKKIWGEWVADNIIIKTTSHKILRSGKHIVKYWMVSPAVILQKIVIDFGGLKESYLGPPETLFK